MLELETDQELKLHRGISALRGLAALMIPSGRAHHDDEMLARRQDLGALMEIIERELRAAAKLE